MPAVILFSILVALVFAIFFVFGLPLGHSHLVNITWSSAFTNQFLAGDFYPRWLFEIHQGAGRPVFYF